MKTNSVNVNKSDQNSIHHYRCIIFPSPPISPSFQTELSISCCWSACKFLNFLSVWWDQNCFEVVFKFFTQLWFSKIFPLILTWLLYFPKIVVRNLLQLWMKLFSSLQHVEKKSLRKKIIWGNRWRTYKISNATSERMWLYCATKSFKSCILLGRWLRTIAWLQLWSLGPNKLQGVGICPLPTDKLYT